MYVFDLHTKEIQSALLALNALEGRLEGLVLDNAQSKVLTSDKVCKMLGISQKTLQRHRKSGKLAYSKIGQKVVYHLDDVTQFLEENSWD